MNKNILLDSQYRSSKRYTLLTGATGLVGRYLMKELLLKGTKLAVLVRPTKRERVRERVEAILQMWEAQLGHRLPRPVILSGDVCSPNLGMSEKQFQWAGEYCNQIVHGAAVLRFQGATRADEPWKTNLGGTQNVLEFAESNQIKHFHYISTAYVCGKRDETVFEDDLEAEQSFRNDYEISKFEAEKLVRAATCFDTTTIYRPAVIAGDSETGYTSTYHGIFLYLRLMAMVIPEQKRNEEGVFETPIKLPLEGDEPRNVVPIDWIGKTISHLVSTPEAHGRTYHLVPDNCTTARELIEACYEYFHSAGVEFCGSSVDRTGDDEFAQKMLANTSIYASYEKSDPHFDKRNVLRFAGHLVCPPIDKEAIFRFLEFGKADKWGKARVAPPKVARWIESHLTEIALAAQKTMGALRINGANRLLKIGLDIHGPGGGQWQMSTCDGRFEVTPGLPDDSCPVLRLSDLQINDLLLRTDDESESSDSPVSEIDWSEPLETVMNEKTDVE